MALPNVGLSTSRERIMSRLTLLPSTTTATGYDGNTIRVGTVVRNIESGWIGRVMSFEQLDGDTMVHCYHEHNGEPELDDHGWYDPADMVVAHRKLEWSALWKAMQCYPDAWIETTEEMNWEQLCCMPPAAGGNGYFLVGEPARHNSAGESVFACFRKEGERYFAKYQTVKEFRRNR
jgi:hypothetical protein